MNKFITLLQSIKPVNDKNLPNIWLLVECFRTFFNIKYCNTYNSFYLYHNNFWNKIAMEQIQELFLDFIQIRFPNAYTSFQLNNVSHILLLLKRHSISMPECKRIANSNGFLLPFLNGVLNTLTLQLLPHHDSNYITHIIPVNFDITVNTLANTAMSKFLMEICNFSANRLNVLRACLYCLFVNDLSNQIALYIYGPGGTGKSTLVNMLLYLLGPEASLSTTINQLNSRFGIASLVDKILVLLNDISLFRGAEPKVIKEIVTGDRLMGEFKFLSPFQFTPTAFLIITSNILWDIKNATTGISRRFIYFPFDFIPGVNKKIPDLFKITQDGNISGILTPFFSAFIMWILTCPKEYLDLLKTGGLAITQLISQDGLLTHPLQTWVSEWLTFNPTGMVQVGNNKSNTSTLYGNYLQWAIMNGVTPLKFNQFSNLLIDLLNSIHWKVERKRRAAGTVIIGVELRTTPNIIPSIQLGQGSDKITDKSFEITQFKK